GGYEGLREILGLSNVAVVPNADVHRGCLPVAGRPGELRCVGVASSVGPYLALLPLPNGPDHGDGTADYFSSPARVTREDNFTVRLDHQLGARDSLFVRYTFDDSGVTIPDKIPTFGVALKSRYQYATVEEKHAFSANTLNAFRFSYNRSFSDSRATQTLGPTPELAFLPGQELIGTINIEALVTTVFEGGFGTQAPLPRTFAYNLFEASDDVSHARGAHSFKWGFGFKRNQLNAQELANNPRGIYGFRTLEDFLRGRPFLFRGEAPGTSTERGWRQSIFGFYGQDDFRPRHNLTLNLGLRYEFVTTPTEVHGRSSALVRVTDPDVTPGPIWVRNPSLKNFAPRVGLAWDPHADGRSSVRVGFGMYYDLPVSYFYSIQGSRTFPYSFTGTVNNPPFPRPSDIFITPSARSLNVFNPDLATPAKIQYSLTYQRELWGGAVVTAGFVGGDGYHLLRHEEANHFIPTVLADGRHFYPAGAPRVNPNFNTIRMASTDVTSSYRALQLEVERRFADGFAFQVAYTLSKSTDTNSGAWGTDIRNQESFAEDPLDLARDLAPSGFDTRHVLTFNYSYLIPTGRARRGLAGLLAGGWQLNGITTLSSGQPFTVVLGGNRSRTYPGNTRSRPDLRPGFAGDIILGGPDRYFDPAAFVAPPAGFTGNVGRNSLYGPGLVNFDVSLAKLVRLGESRSLQFRVEAFNVFNRANFGIPLRVVFDSAGSPIGSAGQIKNTVTPSRQVQLGLKFAF
ncbi:MAG TPA: TonB-dependent receptor, partial [Pyrinomonadaceae bacterium]